MDLRTSIWVAATAVLLITVPVTIIVLLWGVTGAFSAGEENLIGATFWAAISLAPLVTSILVLRSRLKEKPAANAVLLAALALLASTLLALFALGFTAGGI